MTSFAQTVNPTSFGFFDSDPAFQTEADSMVTFVKRKLGDDILAVELTKRQIWACFEESLLEYGRLINEFNIVSQLTNLLGQSTGSMVNGAYPAQTLEFLLRQTQPYSYGDGGGGFDTILGYIPLENGRQDYNLYTELLDPGTKTSVYSNLLLTSGTVGRLRVIDILHFSPVAAQSFLLNSSNVSNFLASEMQYESYTNSTAFHVLPIFEDVLRRGMLEAAFRVRRSNYSYELHGRSLRIYPAPSTFVGTVTNLWVRVAAPVSALSSDYGDAVSGSISNASNVPYVNIAFSAINSPGRQWVREFTMALAKEILGLVRGKMKTIQIPNAELSLNGDDLVQQAREDKEKLLTTLREFLGSITYDKLAAIEAQKAENIATQLRYLPAPGGRAIVVG
jgi:hypothetical protein